MSHLDTKKVVYLQEIYKELEALVKEVEVAEGSTETDPVFSASPAASITQPNIATWNSSLQPGANVSTLTDDVGYITSETDPVFIASPASSITSGNIISWNSATQPGDNVSTLTNDAGYITGTTGFSGSFVTATDTITVVDGLITTVTPL